MKLSAVNIEIGIVVSDFNKRIITNLLKGALDSYIYYGGVKSDLKIYHVPGAFEIPATVKQIINTNSVDAIVAIGSVIRGDTPHFDYIATESARGLADVGRDANIPVINGILTTDNVKQAVNRSYPTELGLSHGNKGWDAMEAALHMVGVYKEIKSAS